MTSTRIKYNKGIVISGIVSFILVILIDEFIAQPRGIDFEITIFTIVIQGILFCLYLSVANLIFSFGKMLEQIIKPNEPIKFRIRSFKIGFYLFCSIPLFVPILLLIKTLFYR